MQIKKLKSNASHRSLITHKRRRRSGLQLMGLLLPSFLIATRWVAVILFGCCWTLLCYSGNSFFYSFCSVSTTILCSNLILRFSWHLAAAVFLETRDKKKITMKCATVIVSFDGCFCYSVVYSLWNNKGMKWNGLSFYFKKKMPRIPYFIFCNK